MESRQLLRALEQEWAVISSSRRGRRTLDRWRQQCPVLAPVGSLAALVDTIRGIGCDHDSSVEVSRAVLGLADRDDLARRTVLQAIMPGLMSELMRVCIPAQLSPSQSFDRVGNEVEQVLVVAANEAICAAVGTDSRWPMATIVRRTHRLVIQALKADRRWRGANVSTWLADEFESVPAVSGDGGATAELVEMVDEVRRMNLLSDADRDLILAYRCFGYSMRELASRHGASLEAVARRRSRAESRLRVGALALRRDLAAA